MNIDELEVGMKVIVDPNLREGECKICNSQDAVSGMLRFKGKVVTITKVDKSTNVGNEINEDSRSYWWCSHMFIPLIKDRSEAKILLIKGVIDEKTYKSYENIDS